MNKFSKKDLRDGDIVTYRNGSKRVVRGDKTYYMDRVGFSMNLSSYKDDLTTFSISDVDPFDIVKVERHQVVFERKDILDKQEKEYLSAVIKPFRKNVIDIVKSTSPVTYGVEYICIRVKNHDCGNLPNFKAGTMYKGMEVNKKYSLEELGL